MAANRIHCHMCNKRRPKAGSKAMIDRQLFVCENCAETLRPYFDAVTAAVVRSVRRSLVTGQPLPSISELVDGIEKPSLAAAG